MAEFPAGGENRIVDEDGEDPEPEEGYRLLKVPGGYLVRLYRGFQVMETLKKVLKAKKITAGSIQGIGALEDIELGYYHLDKKEYSRKTLSGTWELVSWMGNISYLDSQPFIHAHAVLSDAEMNTRGGHFFEALVAVTLEAYIVTAPEEIIRLHDEETGLFLMKL
ncbi:MAG TPA: DUF296 domain-containing protein [Calditrichia bacterium]|nr:DUF296 domain-containing protein [Calditrichia bacterium]